MVLERRDIVGGAAVTEELYPGFNFTTFSYAISLLRPDIVADLDLVKHGMMVLPMASNFAPMENGDYLLLGADADTNYHEIARHSKRDAERYGDWGTIMDRVCQAVKPLLDEIPPNIVSDDPYELAAVARLGSHLRDQDPKVLHMLVRLLTGSAAEILDEYFESEILKATLASSGIIGTKVGPRSQGSGLVLLYHILGEVDGVFGEWGFHKGGNGGFTQAVARAAESFGVEIRTGASVANVITKHGEAVGVALESGEEILAATVVSSLDPRRTFLQFVDRRELPSDLVEHIENFKFQGTSAKVNFALDGVPNFPALAGQTDHYRGFINIGPRSTISNALSTTPNTERSASSPSLMPASNRCWILICLRQANTSCRASSSTRPMNCAIQTGTPSGATSATRCKTSWRATSLASVT